MWERKGHLWYPATIGKQVLYWFNLHVSVECCKKIIKEKLAGPKVPDAAFQTFTMSVYCFPDPASGKQALIISAIGYSENQMSEYYIRMTDLEKIQTCKRCMDGAMLMGMKGLLFDFR